MAAKDDRIADALTRFDIARLQRDYLLSTRPYGALVWGAYLLGKGLKFTVQIALSERDREMREKVGKEGTS